MTDVQALNVHAGSDPVIMCYGTGWCQRHRRRMADCIDEIRERLAIVTAERNALTDKFDSALRLVSQFRKRDNERLNAHFLPARSDKEWKAVGFPLLPAEIAMAKRAVPATPP